MAGNKIFYVTRTEDEATQTAGAATKTRADKPQLLKIVGVDHAGNPNPATPEDNQIYATEEEKQEILLTSDTVQDGDLNPVTSDAVFHFAKPPRPDWANAVAITAAQIYAGYTAPSDGLFVCTCVMPETQGNDSRRVITVNNIPIAEGQFSTGALYSYDGCSCPVSEGDLIKSNMPSAWDGETRHFVPWK